MIELTKAELERLYKSENNHFVCEKLKISQPTLIKYLKENGIPMKGKGSGNKGHTGKKLLIT
jgi:hypothetical protein